MNDFLQKLQSNSITNLNELAENDCRYDFKGTLKEFIDYVYQGVIKVLVVNDYPLGMNFVTNLSKEEDQIAQARFAKVYYDKPLFMWLKIAFELAETKEKIGYIVSDYYIFLTDKKQIIDLSGDVVIDCSDQTFDYEYELIEYMKEQLDSYLEHSFDEEDEDDDWEDEEDYWEDEDDEEDSEEEQVSNQVDSDLPSSTVIRSAEVYSSKGTTLQNKVKSYLRDTYGYYIAGDCQLNISVEDDIMRVDNISWGRKKY